MDETQTKIATAIPGQTKMTSMEWLEWSKIMIDKEEVRRQQARLDQAIGKPALFLPWQGEFGHRWMHHARLVHFIRGTTEKIVCCKPGEECLYPTATSFFTSWDNVIPDSERGGTDRAIRHWPEITKHFPQHVPIQAGGLTFSEEWRCIEPNSRIHFFPKKRNYYADVCIGTRRRGFLPNKNWKHCQIVADTVRSLGYTFATIGHPSTAYHLDGELCMSGDFDVDLGVELIQNCKLYFGQDSGGAHMASTIGCDMVVLDVPDQILGRTIAPTRTFFDRMQLVNNDHKMVRIDRNLWDRPQDVAAIVLKTLKEIDGLPTH